ncbi:MAG: thioredoxin domain-containing protein [Saprospiraceae bacterium]|nr:thioredoxin domain-containing protein [Saprospiraceae bacterium]MDZ4706505.1 thioredoxin domain-containing protein [Saprospiraceae bacterium]
MRIALVLAFQILAVAALMAQQGGMKFTERAWSELLAKAKATDQIIFMDAYTTWCGPCKMMSKNVFTDKEVGDYYNANFINVKMDMEKGEGIDLASKYAVRAYPTLLFIDGDGAIVHRAVGYHEASAFVELGKKAKDPSSRISGMKARFASGDRDPDFLQTYTQSLSDAMDSGVGDAADAYLATQSDWNTQENLQFIFQYVESADSKLFDHLIKNKAAFEQTFGKEVVMGKVEQLIAQKVLEGDQPDLKVADALYAKVYPEMAGEMSARFRMNYYQMTGDMNNFAQSAVAFFDKYPSKDMMQLNNVAWAFYESVTDKAMLKKAVGWAKASIKLDAQYFNSDTLAALYYKIGDKKKSKKAALAAIEIAKKNGEDYSGTEQFLK